MEAVMTRGGLRRESVGWSIGLGVLLVVIGLLALAAPLLAGVALTSIFAVVPAAGRRGAPGLCMAPATCGRAGVGAAGGSGLHRDGGVSVSTPGGGAGDADGVPGRIPGVQGCGGTGGLVRDQARAGQRMAAVWWGYFAGAGGDDLCTAAVFRGVGAGDADWDCDTFQRGVAAGAGNVGAADASAHRVTACTAPVAATTNQAIKETATTRVVAVITRAGMLRRR